MDKCYTMIEKKLPKWGDDPLSTFFSDAEYNDRVTSINLADIYALLQRIHSAFKCVEEIIEKDNREELLVPRILMIRTHSSFLAAIRLAMSGQLSESYTVLRAAIEQAWYALHISKDPQAPNCAKVWLCRNDDEASKDKCKDEFKVSNVRSTHESLDFSTAEELKNLYETMIDFGAHPNQSGMLMAMSMTEREKQIDYQLGILFPNKIALITTLRLAVAVTVGAFKVFQLIFPERFKIMGMDGEIEKLVIQLNTVFKPYIQRS